MALAAGGDGLVVDDFGERQAAGDEGEGGFGFGVFCGVEAGEADVEAGFEGAAVGWSGLWRGWRRPARSRAAAYWALPRARSAAV